MSPEIEKILNANSALFAAAEALKKAAELNNVPVDDQDLLNALILLAKKKSVVK